MESKGIALKATMLLYPVGEIDEGLEFFQKALGLPVKFRDGQRFCALDAGGFTVGLVAHEERIVDQPAVVYRVEDIAGTVERLVSAGAIVLSPVAKGPHEMRAVLRDRQGFPLVVTEKLA
jgi:predicted enzyme related to lactoylglutathione lyase